MKKNIPVSVFPNSAPRSSIVTSLLYVCGALPVIASFAVQAATPIPPPDSGSLLQQNKPNQPAAPSGNNPGLILEPQTKSKFPAGERFMVNKIEIDGNTVFDTPILHSLVADLEGTEQTLQQLGDAATRISEYYHSHGYPLARAYIKAQVIRDGIVHITVLEAHYGQIKMTNQSLVNDDVVSSTLSALKIGSQVEQSQLDRTLLLLSDIPGVSAAAIVKPGEAVGTSDLIIDANATPSWSGNAALDNYGNHFTGLTRLSGTFNWIDPMKLGDVLSVSALTTGRDMDNLSVTYETQLSGQGARVGGNISALHYTLGDSLSSLDGHGIAQTASLWAKYPWQRGRDVNVYSQVQLDYKKLDDEIDSAGIQTNRHINSAAFSLYGDERDNVLAGAVTSWSSAWKAGQLQFDNGDAKVLDSESAVTQGGFLKWNGFYSRLQNLSSDTAVFVSLSAQWSNKNLDSAEKMVAGGAYTVRAYDMGTVSGDIGVLGNLELRQNLPQLSNFGQWQAVLFIDSEHVTVNQTIWSATPNSANLTGTGLGLNWNDSSGWHARVYAAAPVGSEPAMISEGKKTRAWVEFGGWF